MKKVISLALVMLLMFGLGACTKETKAEGLQVGFGRVSILPDDIGVQIAGGDASQRISTGYMDELSATCIAISEGDETILLYTIDFIVVSAEVYAAQDYISEATGVPTKNIILNTTHTHSGVSIRSSWTGVAEYKEKYNNAAVEAAQKAIADQSAAEVYYGSTVTDIVFVRNYLLEDGTAFGNRHGDNSNSEIKEHRYDADGELQVIKFARAAEDKKDVVLMNLGAHATIVNTLDPNVLSADWPGVARSYVEANSDSLCAVFEGAAGDQIPFSKIKGLCPVGNKMPEYGNAVGEFCLSVLNGEMTKADGTGIDLVQYLHEGSYNLEMHVMQIHGVSLIFAPYEMFGGSAQELKTGSPYDMTFIITCSENQYGYHAGYIPTPIAYADNAYEAQVAKCPEGTAEELVQAYINLLTEMKNGSVGATE